MKTPKNIILGLALLLAAAAIAGPGVGDSTFLPSISSSVNSVAMQPDGRIVLGGNFFTINNISRSRIARVFADGSLDTTFGAAAGASSTVNSVFVQSDGRIMIGGAFTSVSGTTRGGIARLNFNGSVDGSFVPTNYTTVNAVAVQSDAKVINR